MPSPADRLARLAAERRLFTPGPRGPLAVCLVYPNTYAVGMGNLGFQAVLRILSDDPHVTVDRAFLPDGPRPEWPRTLRALESDRPVGDFDVIAFSISFETDYLHVLDILALVGLRLRRDARGSGAPLVLAGGPATFLNPEPLAEFVDLFLIGEAEEMLPEFVARAAAGAPGREALLERTEDVAGEDERGAGSACVPAQRHAGEREDVQDVQVVGLEGDGEGDDVEVAHGTLALQRAQRARPSRARSVRQERAIDGDVWVVRQDPQDRLEAQVAHADRIGVGIDQAHREGPSRAGREEPALGGQAGETVGRTVHRRLAGPYPRPSATSRRRPGGADARTSSCQPAFAFGTGTAQLTAARERAPTCPKTAKPSETPDGAVKMSGVTQNGAPFRGTLAVEGEAIHGARPPSRRRSSRGTRTRRAAGGPPGA